MLNEMPLSAWWTFSSLPVHWWEFQYQDIGIYWSFRWWALMALMALMASDVTCCDISLPYQVFGLLVMLRRQPNFRWYLLTARIVTYIEYANIRISELVFLRILCRSSSFKNDSARRNPAQSFQVSSVLLVPVVSFRPSSTGLSLLLRHHLLPGRMTPLQTAQMHTM